MEKQHKRSLSLLSLSMLFLLPIFFVGVFILSLQTGQRIYRMIEKGFDRKLNAISTSVSHFIDGHVMVNDIFTSYNITGLTFDTHRKHFWGIDQKSDRLCMIHPEHGGVEHVIPGQHGLIDLDYHSPSKTLFGVKASGEIWAASSSNFKKMTYIASTDLECRGIAVDPNQERMYLIGEKLAAYNFSQEKLYIIDARSFSHCTGLAYNSTENFLYTFDNKNKRLLKLDPCQGTIQTETEIAYIKKTSLDLEFNKSLDERQFKEALYYDRIRKTGDAELRDRSWKYLNILTKQIYHQIQNRETQITQLNGIACNGLAFGPDSQTLYSAANQLIQIDPEDRAISPVGWAPNFRSHTSSSYLSYVLPMRRIKQKLDITYLYTFIRPENESIDSIAYVLDANVDDNHSMIGDRDSFPSGAGQDIYGTVQVGGLKQTQPIYWEQWGWIKTAYAPIYDSSNEVRGVMGTDINVSVINSKTRNATIRTVVIGFTAFVLSCFLVYIVCLAIIRPIQHLREKMFIVASGQYGEEAHVQGSRELRQMAEAFNQMSRSLHTFFENQSQSLQTLQERIATMRLRHRLTRAIVHRVESDCYSIQIYQDCTGQQSNLSGCIQHENHLLLWLGNQMDSPEGREMLNHQISTFCHHILSLPTLPKERLEISLPYWFKSGVTAFLWIENNSGSFWIHTKETLSCILLDSKEEWNKLIQLNNRDSILSSKEWVFGYEQNMKWLLNQPWFQVDSHQNSRQVKKQLEERPPAPPIVYLEKKP